MIGSACFAVASIPALAEIVPAEAIGITYFVGSIFFTSASLLVLVTTTRSKVATQIHRPRPRTHVVEMVLDLVVWAAAIQLIGTIWFNISTFEAMDQMLSAHGENLRVWSPDFFGSVCFLLSSGLSWFAFCNAPWCADRANPAWRSTLLNLIGSVMFMLAAIAAYTLPSTGDLLDASLANSGTMLGALCFLWGARLLLVTAAPGSGTDESIGADASDMGEVHAER
jgi:hypothetical protein